MSAKITQFFSKLGPAGSTCEKRKPEVEVIVIAENETPSKESNEQAHAQKKSRTAPPLPAEAAGAAEPRDEVQEVEAATISSNSRGRHGHSQAGDTSEHAIQLLTFSPPGPQLPPTRPASSNTHASQDPPAFTPTGKSSTPDPDAPVSRATPSAIPAMKLPPPSQPTAPRQQTQTPSLAERQASQDGACAALPTVPIDLAADQVTTTAAPLAAATHNPASTPPGPSAHDPTAAAALALQGDREQLLNSLSRELEETRQALRQELLLPCQLNDAAAAGASNHACSEAAAATDGTDSTTATGAGAHAPRLRLSQTAEVAAYLEGQICPLTQLLSRLVAATAEPEATVRAVVTELATRKSYSAQKGSDSSALLLAAAAAEDATPGSLWVWELRDLKSLSTLKSQKKLAELHRKRRKGLHDRLMVLSNVIELLQHRPVTKTSESKLLKSMQRVYKVPSLQQQQQQQAEANHPERASALKEATPGPSMQQQQDGADKAVKAVKDAEKAAAKEAEKSAREAEKAAEKAERAAKEQADREQERAAKGAAKEDTKAAKKGFGDAKTLNNSAKFMQRFVGITPSKAAAVREVTAAAPEAGTPSAGSQSQLTSQQKQQRRTGLPLPDGGGEQESARVEDMRSVLDASWRKGLPAVAPEQYVAELKASWKRGGSGAGTAAHLIRSSSSRCRLLGVPPTWARRPSCSLDPAEHLSRHYGEGADWSRARAWRRKLLLFDKCNRPAFYGSFSLQSKIIRPRKPLAQDTSLLDYDNDSDEDWEEEPEGEDLGDGDPMEEDEPEAVADADEEQGDVFMVDDGYLSADEGVKDSQVEPGEADPGVSAEAGEPAQPLAFGRCTVDPRLQQLQAAIDRAAKSNRCLVLIQDRAISCEHSSGMDLQVLDALNPVFLKSGPPSRNTIQDWGTYSFFGLSEPEGLKSSTEAAGVQVGGGSASDAAAPVPGSSAAVAVGSAAGPARGRPVTMLPEPLAPVLLAFISDKGSGKIDQLVDGFISSHPDHTLSKKSVKDFIKARAAYDHKAGAWKLKQHAEPAAAAAAAQGATVKPAAAGVDASAAAHRTPPGVSTASKIPLLATAQVTPPALGSQQQQQQQQALSLGTAGAVPPQAPSDANAPRVTAMVAGAAGRVQLPTQHILDLTQLPTGLAKTPTATFSARPKPSSGIQNFFTKAATTQSAAGSAAAASSTPLQQRSHATPGPGPASVTVTPVPARGHHSTSAAAPLEEPTCAPTPGPPRAPANTPVTHQRQQGQMLITPRLEAARAGLDSLPHRAET